MSLTRLTTRDFLKLNYKGLSYVFNRENKIQNTCFHAKHSVNFLPKGFRKYSTECLGVQDKKYNYSIDEAEDEKKQREKIFNEIANGDPEILKKLKVLEFEIAVLKEEGKHVINNPKKLHWEELLRNFDASARHKMRLLSFMALNEKKKYNEAKKKSYKMMLKLRKKEAGFYYYGLSGQSIIPRIIDNGATLNKIANLRQMMARHKVVIDCSYDQFMSEICKKNLAKQIHMCVAEMQKALYPCQLSFSNLDQNTNFGKIIQKYVPNIFNENFHCDVSPQNITDIYPRDDIVYLSPHSSANLIEVNENDIYVIGGFVDKGVTVEASLAKAKKENLRVAKLPIDLYTVWRQGTKSLPINVVLKVLTDMMFYKDWNYAFRSIANRSMNHIFYRCGNSNDDVDDGFDSIND